MTSACPRCDVEGDHLETNRAGSLYECAECGMDYIV